MKIVRILNNNAIVAKDERNREVVLLGAGLGFVKGKGEPVDETKIEKRFYMDDKQTTNQFAELIESIPIEYIFLTQQIIDEAKIKYGKKLADTIYISLPDHIANAVENQKNGIATRNPFLLDIKRFYKDEFEIGKYALDIVLEKTGIQLEQDEAAYVALHFVNAEIGGVRDEALEVTKIMQEISSIVQKRFGIEYDEESLFYYRFVTHLKFFALRVLSKTCYEDNDTDLFEMVTAKYHEEYSCVQEISTYLEENFHYKVGVDEQTYLTVHIARITK